MNKNILPGVVTALLTVMGVFPLLTTLQYTGIGSGSSARPGYGTGTLPGVELKSLFNTRVKLLYAELGYISLAM